MPPPPACSIDFTRRFSLPFGVPPEILDSAKLGDYLGGLGLQAEFLFYDRTALTDLDPQSPGQRRVRTIAAAAPGDPEVVLPRSTNPGPAPALTPKVLSQASIKAVGQDKWKAAKPSGGRSAVQVAASTFRWDPSSRQVAAVPIPTPSDEGLVLWWNSTSPSGGLLAAPIPGVLAADDSAYLLATGTAGRDGELDRLLLRAPAVGLVRFERYQHLRLAGATLSTSHPSQAGRLVLRSVPVHLYPPEGGSPLFDGEVLVFENVALDSAIECLSSLGLLQLLRAADLLKDKKLKGDVTAQLSWFLRAWLAFLRVQPAVPDVYPTLPAPLRTPFEQGKPGTGAQVLALLAHVLGHPDTRTSAVGFLRNFYVPLLCGRTWHHLGVELPTDPAARPPALKVAHATLENLPRASDAWLACYAGCPLGRPATLYGPDAGPLPEPHELPVAALTTFELEALAIAEQTPAVYPGITAPPLPDLLDPLDLTAFAAKARGTVAVLRVIEGPKSVPGYRGYDWLAEVVKGAHRLLPPEDPLVHFDDFAAPARPPAQRHPLADPIDWSDWSDAQTVRAQLDALAVAPAGAGSLDLAILQWWIDKTGIALGPTHTWPTENPFEGVTEVPAGPRDPFLDEETRAGVSGFDAFDVEAASLVAALLNSAKDPTADIPLGLVLALMDKEGYRAGARQDRTGVLAAGWRPQHTPRVRDPLAPGGSRAPRRGELDPPVIAGGQPWLDAVAIYDWIHFPYGLDVFMQLPPSPPPAPQDRIPVDPWKASLVKNARTAFVDRIGDIQRGGVIESDRAAPYLYDFGLRRVEGGFDAAGPMGVLRNRRRSRRLQWLALICQQGEFQLRHQVLHNASDPTNPYNEVDEFTDAALPSPGPDANSPERRAFIAYYALLYLAFNIKAETWNDWVRSADARPAGTSVSEFLVYFKNPAGHARDLLPALPPPDARRQLFQRANMLRFAVALDAYLRINPSGAAPPDTSDPALRAW